MTVTDLLHELGALGIELFLDDKDLRFRGPKGALTDELRRQIANRREGLIRQLRESAHPELSETGQRCRRCVRREWVDAQPVDGRIRTHCGRCGRFIGYRPENL